MSVVRTVPLWSRGLLARLLVQLAIAAAAMVSCVDVRLRGSETQWDGRVEVLHEKEWGSVCDVGWDFADANVTCRQLGFSLAVGVTTVSSYGDDVRVWVEGVECEGDESDIGECVSMGGWGVVSSDCENHTRDAGVICADDPNALSVRLVGGATVKEGRVEVLFGDKWGGVCDDGWGLEEADVVCRQIGYDYAEGLPNEGEFGEGVEVIWLDNIVCGGEEKRLTDCQHAGWAEHNCLPSENAGVHCALSDTNNCSVRVSSGSTLARPWAGAVELFANDEWGRVCSDTWDLSDATVLCRQLGYYGALEATSLLSSPPSELYWLAGVECTGSEDILCDCPANGVVNSNCETMSDAGVACKAVTGDAYAIRLVGGAYEWEGRVEVSVNGEWGTVCSLSAITESEYVDVICRQLGYGRLLVSYFNDLFGGGSGVQWFGGFTCSGTEDSIFTCPHRGIGQTDLACSHMFDLSVICKANTTNDNETAPIRLVGGTTQYEGRVEVLYNGRWGLVCDDGWNMATADVTCAQFGYGGALSYMDSFTTASVATGPIPIWLDDIMCNGTETSLSACPHSMWGQHDCSPNDDAAGVTCSEPVSDSHNVRLVGGPVENSGRVEIFYGGVWGTVCNIGWDFDDADVVCRQLGYPGAMSLLGDDILREGEGVVWLEGIGCHGNESQLVECGLSGWGESQCNHSMDAGVICEEMLEPSVIITSSPLTSPLVTSPLLLLPLSPSPDQVSSVMDIPPATKESGVFVTKTTQLATPTGDLSTSEGNNVIRVPVVVIGVAGTLIGVLSVAIAAIVITVLCAVRYHVRARRKRKVVIYDTVGSWNGMGVRSDPDSLSVSFSSLPQHTDDDTPLEDPHGVSRPPGGITMNFNSTHPELNAHFKNPQADEESLSTCTASPCHETTPTQTPSHDPTASIMELQSLEENLLTISGNSTNPLTTRRDTFV